MKLVYTKTETEVKVGDVVNIGEEDEVENVEVIHFREPHKSSSSGKVSVKYVDHDWSREFYVSVIGAEWIEREDRVDG